MIKRLSIEPMINNECQICGSSPTTAEGLMCRKHWDMAIGEHKAAYILARTRLVYDVYAKENSKC